MEKSFCGVLIMDVTMDQLLNDIKSIGVPKADYLVTPNVDHFQKLEIYESPLLVAYQSARYIVCDSRIVRAISFLEKDRLRNVIPGSDLTRVILSDPWFRRRKIAVIGSTPEDIRRVKDKYSIETLIHYAPPMGFIRSPIEIQKCVDFVAQSEPEFVFLAVGCPQQETLAHELWVQLREAKSAFKVAFCVGASFDFLSGRVARAPVWMQRLSLEWLFRMSADFNRLAPRYYKNFAWLVRYVLRRVGR